MKKTLMINISGIIFHIDEDAYILLNDYLESIKKHFGNSEGREEIIHDIECRIAELLQQKISDTKQVVLEGDIMEVIGVMGLPRQFDAETGGDGQAKTHAVHVQKRFFRDPDAKILGGVCAGIGAYFHLDPLWVRTFFIISLFAGGLGILLYFILWVVIPEAGTTAEKLEMRGERINISSIESSIRSEISHLKSRIDTMTNGTGRREKKKKSSGPGVPELLINALVSILKVTFRIVLIILGITFVLTGMAIIIAILAFAFGWGGVIAVEHNEIIPSLPVLASIFLGTKVKFVFIQFSLILLLGIPALLMFYNGLWLVIRFRRIKNFGLNAFYFWILGLILAVFFTLKIADMYRFGEVKKEKVALHQPKHDTLNVSLVNDDSLIRYLDRDPFTIFDDIQMIEGENNHLYLLPSIEIRVSSDSLFGVTKYIYARGKSPQEARERIEKVRYEVSSNDSLLLLKPFVYMPKGESWRGHEVKLIIDVPRGKWIQFDEGTRKIFHHARNHYYLDDEFPGSAVDIISPKTLRMTDYGLE